MDQARLSPSGCSATVMATQDCNDDATQPSEIIDTSQVDSIPLGM